MAKPLDGDREGQVRSPRAIRQGSYKKRPNCALSAILLLSLRLWLAGTPTAGSLLSITRRDRAWCALTALSLSPDALRQFYTGSEPK